MKPHNYLIAIGLFSLVVVAMLLVAVDLHSTYTNMGVSVPAIDENESKAFSKLSDIQTQANQSLEEIRGTDIGSEDASTTFLGGAIKSFQIVIYSLTVPYSIIESIADLFDIPAVFVGFAFTVIILTIVWTGIYMIFKSSGE